MQLARIPPGEAGTVATVSTMRRLVLRAVASPVVRETVRALLLGTPTRNASAQVFAIRQWLSDHVIFLRDPDGVELLHAPDWMLHQIHTRGRLMVDCDDVAILAATLAKAAGLPARFVVLGFIPGRGYQHVFTEVFDGRSWVDLDVTRPGAVPRVERASFINV